MRTARLGLEGCESFVDDLIGCRVLYSVRDALLHRSLEIQPWHFPIRYFFFLCIGRCWVVHPDLALAVDARAAHGWAGAAPPAAWG